MDIAQIFIIDVMLSIAIGELSVLIYYKINKIANYLKE